MLEQDIKKVLVSHDEIVVAAQNLGAQSYFCRNSKRFHSFYGRVDKAC